jgi:tRNA-modifying protein YgfZ
MTQVHQALLDDRGVVRVTGDDATSFLDNLITQDLAGMANGDARFAALLTPQGKILFDFFVVCTADGFLLDVAREKATDLVKRLALYKLRAKVAITDHSGHSKIFARWEAGAIRHPEYVSYLDPRDGLLGFRDIWLGDLAAEPFNPPPGDGHNVDAYRELRVILGIPEGGKDYAFGDAFPHEANMDRFNGVSFSKGCFVGQEVVARMQHKTVVRKRVVRVKGHRQLTEKGVVKLGEVAIGTVGSCSGVLALAMLRLDRALEARSLDQEITVDGIPLRVFPEELEQYRNESAAKSEQKAARI